MIAKVRIGNYIGKLGSDEYSMGNFVEIDGKRYDDISEVKITTRYNEPTAATITFTGNVGFIKSEADRSIHLCSLS